MNPKVASFNCTHSPNLPEILHQLNCPLALSTYQAGKVVFVGAFQDLPIAVRSMFFGVVVVHLPTAHIVADLTYADSVEEIYDIRIMHGMRRPGLVNNQKAEYVWHSRRRKTTGSYKTKGK